MLLLALLPLAQKIYSEWPEIQKSIAGVDSVRLLLSLLLLLAALGLMPTISWVVLHELAVRLPFPQIFSIYFMSQVAKYLPGGFWAFPGRMIAYQTAGVQVSKSVLSVFREVVALFLGAVAVGMLVAFQDIPLSPWLRRAVILGVLACLIFLITTQTSWFWRITAKIPVLNKFAMSVLATPGEHGIALSSRWFLAAFVISTLFWLAMSLPFRELSIAVNPVAAQLSILQAASIYALAWAIGFAVVLVPAGLGVRESALSLLLSTTIPLSDAISIALLSRLAWMIAEAFWVIISLRIFRKFEMVKTKVNDPVQ